MHDIESVKKRIITSMIAILLLIFALFGITYAYFTAKVKGNTNDKSVDVSAGKLELVYKDGNGFIKVDKIQPGEVIKSKTFTVKNTGDGDIDSYEVILENVVNELKYYNDLTYELDCKSDNGTCNGSNDTFPIYDGSIVTNSIKVNETHTYTLTLTYHETNLDQSDDMNKNIEAKVNIRDSEFNYNKLNIYGNAEGLGTLVNNNTDRFNGMYKVDVKSVGKNLFNLDGITGNCVANGTVEKISNGYIATGNYGSSTQNTSYANGWLRPGDSSDYAKVFLKSGDTVTISADIKLLENSTNFTTNNNFSNIYLYGSGGVKALIKNTKLKLNTDGTSTRVYETYTVVDTEYYYPIFTLNNNKLEVTNIQIERGSKKTDYESYNEKVYSIYIKEPLRCLDTVCDYVDLVSKKVIRKIKDDNGTLSLLDNVVEEKIQSIDSDILTDRNIVVDDATNVETELDR